MAKRVNSCRKGKAGELALVNYLKLLGFTDARRTQQHNGAEGKSDVLCEETLPGIHLECKYGVKGMTLGTQLWRDAIAQAKSDSDGEPWVLMWKPYRTQQWLMTWNYYGLNVTLADDCEIQEQLQKMGEAR